MKIKRAGLIAALCLAAIAAGCAKGDWVPYVLQDNFDINTPCATDPHGRTECLPLGMKLSKEDLPDGIGGAFYSHHADTNTWSYADIKRFGLEVKGAVGDHTDAIVVWWDGEADPPRSAEALTAHCSGCGQVYLPARIFSWPKEIGVVPPPSGQVVGCECSFGGIITEAP